VLASVTDPMYFGRTAHASIIGGKSLGSSGSGWDTHDEAYGISFTDCESVGSYKGIDAVGAGGTFRGRYITVTRLRAYKCRYGLQVFEQSDESTIGVVLDHCEAIDSTRYGLYTTALTADGGVRVRNLSVVGGRYEGREAGMRLEYSDVTLGGRPISKIAPTPSSPPSTAWGIYAHEATVLNGDSLTVDFDLSGATNNTVISNTAGSHVSVDNVHVEAGSQHISRLFTGGLTPGTSEGRGWVLSEAPASATIISGYTTGQAKVEYRVRGTGASGTGYVAQTVTADAQAPALADRSDPVVVLGVTCTGGSWYLGKIPDGINPGQMRVVRNVGGSNTVTVRDGTATYGTRMRGGDRELAPGDAVVLIWDGAQWTSADSATTSTDILSSLTANAAAARAAIDTPTVGQASPAKAFSDLIGWTHDPATATLASTILPAAATIYFCRIPLRKQETITNVILNLATVGADLVNAFVGLYKSDGTVLGQSADQSAAWGSGGSTGLKTVALASPVVVTPTSTTDFVWAVVYVGAATTLPTFSRSSTGQSSILNAGTTSSRRRFGSLALASTATLTPVTPSAMSLASSSYWMALS
ncbi:MAG: hypothetical protein WA965_26020, partial [Mycobacterium sp.]